MRKYKTVADQQPNPWDVHRMDVELQEEGTTKGNVCPDIAVHLSDVHSPSLVVDVLLADAVARSKGTDDGTAPVAKEPPQQEKEK